MVVVRKIGVNTWTRRFPSRVAKASSMRLRPVNSASSIQDRNGSKYGSSMPKNLSDIDMSCFLGVRHSRIFPLSIIPLSPVNLQFNSYHCQ